MDAVKKCPVCASEGIKVETGEHHFLESGLDNVILLNVEKLVCSQCGEEVVSIPNPNQLMQCIAEMIVTSPAPLTGAEIRFLRKNLLLKTADFAKLLGVARGSVSRWENGRESPPMPTDRLIRFIYSRREKLSESILSKIDKYLEEEHHPPRPDQYVIPFPLQETMCTEG